MYMVYQHSTHAGMPSVFEVESNGQGQEGMGFCLLRPSQLCLPKADMLRGKTPRPWEIGSCLILVAFCHMLHHISVIPVIPHFSIAQNDLE